MSTAQFRRAKLVPFDAGGRNVEESRAIPLDFNPETLTLKVSAGEQRDRSRRGRQQVQNVGSSKATLSFDCYFDSTRPRDDDTGEDASQDEEMLDVRVRTKPIADLVQTYGSGREQAPRKVQFRWGTLIFNGTISSHQEVFEYFSPSGVPLRSKIQLTLTEQEFRYELTATDAAAQRQAVEQASADARSQAAAANADSLLGGADGNGFDLSAGFSLSASLDLNLDVSLSAQVGLSASFGVSADIGVSVGAGISLDANAAVDLFGGAALGTSSDLSRSGVSVPKPSPGLASAGVTPNPWAPEGPAPGSRAAGLAAVVNDQRASGAVAGQTASATSAATPSASPAAPLPVRGSPPLALRRAPPSGDPLFATARVPVELAAGERRPRWETLPAAAVTSTAARSSTSSTPCGCGCGCARCSGH